MTLYNLHVGNAHLIGEVRYDIRKRNVLIEGQSLEEVDKRTALFPSFKELEEEINQIKGPNNAAIIIIDEGNELGTGIISDIVYSEDIKEIDNRDNIRQWTIEHLKKYPIDLVNFEGIYATYKTNYGIDDREYTEEKLINTVYAYFNNAGYKKYRDVYFELIALSPEVKSRRKWYT